MKHFLLQDFIINNSLKITTETCLGICMDKPLRSIQKYQEIHAKITTNTKGFLPNIIIAGETPGKIP